MEGRSPRDSAHDTTDAPNAVPDGAPGQGMGCGDSTDAVVCVRAAMVRDHTHYPTCFGLRCTTFGMESEQFL